MILNPARPIKKGFSRKPPERVKKTKNKTNARDIIQDPMVGKIGLAVSIEHLVIEHQNNIPDVFQDGPEAVFRVDPGEQGYFRFPPSQLPVLNHPSHEGRRGQNENQPKHRPGIHGSS